MPVSHQIRCDYLTEMSIRGRNLNDRFFPTQILILFRLVSVLGVISLTTERDRRMGVTSIMITPCPGHLIPDEYRVKPRSSSWGALRKGGYSSVMSRAVLRIAVTRMK